MRPSSPTVDSLHPPTLTSVSILCAGATCALLDHHWFKQTIASPEPEALGPRFTPLVMGSPKIIAVPSGSQLASAAAFISGKIDVEMIDLTTVKADGAKPDTQSDSSSGAPHRRAVHRATALAVIQTLHDRGASPPPPPPAQPSSSTFTSAFSGFKRLASVGSSTSSHGIKRTFVVRFPNLKGYMRGR